MPLIFDLDGVIVDSLPLHIEAWAIYLQRLAKPRFELSERMHGRHNAEIVREWIGSDLTEAEIIWHGAEKEKVYREMLRPVLDRQLVPGVCAFLESYQGVAKAVASNAERPNIDLVLDGAKLRHHFSVVLDSEQVQRAKPFPDIYLRAAELLHARISDCVIFEDSPAGVEAGLAAGAKVIGVLTYATVLKGVDLLIRDFRDPKLPAWLEQFGLEHRAGIAGLEHAGND